MRVAWVLQGVGYVVIAVALFYVLSDRQSSTPTASLATQHQSEITTNTMQLRSPAFGHEEVIPSKYTCDGDNISPPLAIDDIPEGTVSLVLIVEDPDVPKSVREDGMWNHWVLFNIPPDTSRIGEGDAPEGVAGITTSNRLTYGGPCPPDGEHRYLFRVYALDTTIDLPEGATKLEVLAAIEGHVIESTTLMGRYRRELDRL